jgi:hypothetical protein
MKARFAKGIPYHLSTGLWLLCLSTALTLPTSAQEVVTGRPTTNVSIDDRRYQELYDKVKRDVDEMKTQIEQIKNCHAQQKFFDINAPNDHCRAVCPSDRVANVTHSFDPPANPANNSRLAGDWADDEENTAGSSKGNAVNNGRTHVILGGNSISTTPDSTEAEEQEDQPQTKATIRSGNSVTAGTSGNKVKPAYVNQGPSTPREERSR